eukprot:9477000-Pyramimonas_sp.AAC.2
MAVWSPSGFGPGRELPSAPPLAQDPWGPKPLSVGRPTDHPLARAGYISASYLYQFRTSRSVSDAGYAYNKSINPPKHIFLSLDCGWGGWR